MVENSARKWLKLNTSYLCTVNQPESAMAAKYITSIHYILQGYIESRINAVWEPREEDLKPRLNSSA